jgi:hypothetical protein
VLARKPSQLFTPLRLAALARPWRPGGNGMRSERVAIPGGLGSTGLGDWQERIEGRPELSAALGGALAPGSVARWSMTAPLLGAAALLAVWHRTGASDSVGAPLGRLLAAQWLCRAGATAAPIWMPSLGFRGFAADYRPWDIDRWPRFLCQAAERAARAGLLELDRLERARDRLLDAAPRRRSPLQGPVLLDLLTSRPAVSSGVTAARLGVSPQAAIGMLGRLAELRLVREITGRGSFRLFCLP